MDHIELLMQASPMAWYDFAAMGIVMAVLLAFGVCLMLAESIGIGIVVLIFSLVSGTITLNAYNDNALVLARIVDEGVCENVLTAIRAGEIKYLGKNEAESVRAICGREEFLSAANADQSVLR